MFRTRNGRKGKHRPVENLSFSTYIILWIAGLFAGFVDSIAGGGGMISLPALLSVGVPPHLALGTNKLQGTFGSFTASLNYSRNGLVAFRGILPGICFTALGALIGTIVIQYLSAKFLSHIMPILLAGVFFYTLFSPNLGEKDRISNTPEFLFYALAGLSLGFYDGFFGPGVGSFWAIAFVLFLGLNLKKGTAHTKIMNFTSNIVSLLAFIFGGHVLYTAGIVMGVGQILGAYLGSHLVMLKGVRFVRIFFLSVVALTILKLIWTTYF